MNLDYLLAGSPVRRYMLLLVCLIIILKVNTKFSKANGHGKRGMVNVEIGGGKA